MRPLKKIRFAAVGCTPKLTTATSADVLEVLSDDPAFGGGVVAPCLAPRASACISSKVPPVASSGACLLAPLSLKPANNS